MQISIIFQFMKDDEKEFLDFQKQEAVLKSARGSVEKWLKLIRATDDLAEDLALHGCSSGAQHVEAASRQIKSMVPLDDLVTLKVMATDIRR